MAYGPLVLVDDDPDDVQIIREVLKELKIDIPFFAFENTQKAKEFLLTHSVRPFIIVCDINLPGQNGMEFKREIDDDVYLKKKSVPFIFYSTSISQQTVNDAYAEFAVQGYFQKAHSFTELRNSWEVMLNYWMTCRHPD